MAQIQMSGQEVTYAALRLLPSPSESQNRFHCDATQRPREAADKGFPVPWRLTAVTLGIFCLLLLVTVTALVTNIFQYIQEKHQQQGVLENLNQSCQYDKYLNEQLLANKSLEYDSLKNKTLKTEEKMKYTNSKCPRKNDISGIKGTFCGGLLFCCGAKCYHFILGNSTWERCKQACQHNGFSLLKSDDEDERSFLKSWTCGMHYWIGLSYDGTQRKWKWIDGSTSGILSVTNSSISRGKCVFLASTREELADCSNTYNCICEKRIGSIL